MKGTYRSQTCCLCGPPRAADLSARRGPCAWVVVMVKEERISAELAAPCRRRSAPIVAPFPRLLRTASRSWTPPAARGRQGRGRDCVHSGRGRGESRSCVHGGRGRSQNCVHGGQDRGRGRSRGHSMVHDGQGRGHSIVRPSRPPLLSRNDVAPARLPRRDDAAPARPLREDDAPAPSTR